MPVYYQGKQNGRNRVMKQYALSILLCILSITSLKAGTTDSLKNALYTYKQDDTGKIALLLSICDNYFYDNPDTLGFYARQALNLSRKMKQPRAEAKAMAYLGEAGFLQGKADSALDLYYKALSISRKINTKDLSAFILNNIGSVHMRRNNYTQAIAYYDTVIILSTTIGSKDLQAAAYSNMASIFFTQGSYATALKQYVHGLKLYEELGNERSIETATLNVANVYNRLGEHEKAKQYVNRALKLAQKSGSAWSVISSYTTLAIVYNEQKQYDSALQCLYTALQLSHKLNNKYLTNLLKGNIAEAHLKKGDLQKAYNLYTETLPVSEELEDIEGVAIAKAGLGEILARQGKEAQGISQLLEALDIVQQANIKEQARTITETLSKIHEQSGNYKQALYYNKIKEAYRDSLLKDDNRRMALSAGYDYELGKKEAQIDLLEKDTALQADKMAGNRLMMVAAIIVAILAVIIAILLFRNMSRTRQQNILITRQKKEIEQQAEKLKRLNSFKDTTFSVLSHDLLSPINALTGTMAMLDEGIITPQEFTEHKNELNNKLQSVTLMLDNLLQWAKSQMKGESTLELEKINVRRKILKTFAVLKDAAQQKNINVSTNAPESLYINADRNQMAMVLRNLLSNAIKFTPQGGSIQVNAEQRGNSVAIMVTDSGVGMTQQQATQLFDGTPNDSTHGTGGEKGTGIGLHLAHNFIINNKGSIAVTSQPGKGTTFTVVLPGA